MRPMYYENPTDSIACATGDEYYWGENIIVAPVLEKATNFKTVYLPKGVWYNYNTKEKEKGEKQFKEPVSLDAIPIYIKAGTILPLYKETVFTSTTALKNDRLTIEYYPSNEKSTYTLYLDDGTSKNALVSNQYELISFSAQTVAEKGYRFSINSNQGNYKGKPVSTLFTLSIVQTKTFKNVFVNGIKQNTSVDYTNNTLCFPIRFTGSPLKIEVK